jgi:hypothetical protein
VWLFVRNIIKCSSWFGILAVGTVRTHFVSGGQHADTWRLLNTLLWQADCFCVILTARSYCWMIVELLPLHCRLQIYETLYKVLVNKH